VTDAGSLVVGDPSLAIDTSGFMVADATLKTGGGGPVAKGATSQLVLEVR